MLILRQNLYKVCRMFKNKEPLTQYQLILLTALFLALFTNISFFKNVIDVYPLNMTNIIYISSLFVVLVSIIVLLLSLFSSKHSTKPLIITFLIVSAFTNYFMNTYQIVIDDSMIRNSIETDLHESMDLFSFELVGYLLFLGILPSVFVYKMPLKFATFKKEALLKLKVIAISVGVIIALLLASSKFYASFFREHKPLRYYTNPTYPIYSSAKFVFDTFKSSKKELKIIGADSIIKDKENEAKTLVIMVVGEAARADRLSLNGYARETTTPKTRGYYKLLKRLFLWNFNSHFSALYVLYI